jgi:hypothetical protein
MLRASIIARRRSEGTVSEHALERSEQVEFLWFAMSDDGRGLQRDARAAGSKGLTG